MRPVTRIALFGLLLPLLAAGQDRDFSQLAARRSPEWAPSAVVYEINVRTFSAAGNFQGVTARLGDLSKLGVNMLWLMPIHPNGQLQKKGTLGSPYSVRDYYAIPDPSVAPGSVISKRDVVDLTGRMKPDGSLDWTPPPRKWMVLRMGYSLTGHQNGPAPAEATIKEAA